MSSLGTNLPGWQSVTLESKFDLTAPDKAQITFPDFATTNAALGQQVEIYRDGGVLWTGVGISSDATLDKNNFKQYVLNCLSNKVYLDREVMSKFYNGQTNYTVPYGGAYQSQQNLLGLEIIQNTIATSIFSDILNSQYAPNLTQGDLGTNPPHVCGLLAARTKALSLLQQLAAGACWECRFNEDNSVDFQPIVGSTTPVLYIREGENITEGGLKVTNDWSKMCNEAVVCGAGTSYGVGSQNVDSQVTAIATNQASINKYGRWTVIKNLANCADQLLLQAYANALVNDLSVPVPTATVEIVDNLKGVYYREGDTVSLDAPTFNIHEQNYRITDIQRAFDNRSKEKIVLTLAQNMHQLSLLEFKMDDALSQAQYFGKAQKVTANALSPIDANIALIYNNTPGLYFTTASPGVTSFVLPTGSSVFHIYMSFSLTGYFTSGYVGAAVTISQGSGLMQTLQAQDLSNGGLTMLAQPSPNPSGQLYTGTPTSVDLSDHIFDFNVNCTVTVGPTTFNLFPLIFFQQPVSPAV